MSLSVDLWVTLQIATGWNGSSVNTSSKYFSLVELSQIEATRSLQMFTCVAALYCEGNSSTQVKNDIK